MTADGKREWAGRPRLELRKVPYSTKLPPALRERLTRPGRTLSGPAMIEEAFELVDKVARLNPDAGEIGPGMLATLVSMARRIG